MKIVFLMLIIFSTSLYADNIALIFEGNKNLTQRELYSALNIQEPYFYEFYKEKPQINTKILPLVEQTVVNYYKSKGFYNTEVHATQTPKSITLHIQENAPVRISKIDVISELALDSDLPFVQGDIFDASKFTQSKTDIKLLYARESYCNASLEAKAIVDIEKKSADLSYRVKPNEHCRVGEIVVTPSKSIDEEIIKSLLYIEEYELFSLENISKSYKNLYTHPGISSALIHTEVDSNATVDINVTITENDNPIRFEGSLGYSSDQGIMVALGVEDRNFFGNLKTLGFYTKFTEIYQLGKMNYSMPLHNGDTFGAEFALKNENYFGFKELATSGTIFLEQRDIPHSFKESLVFDNTYTYDSDNTLLFSEGNLFVLSPKFSWSYDTRDNLLDPTKGYYVSADVMGSVLSFASDASYSKFTLSGGYILPFEKKNYLATKATFGSLNLYDGDIPPSYRFYAGGTYSNRAYSYRALGPKDAQSNPTGFDSIAEVTFEYRFPIYENLRGVLFNDNTAIGESYLPDSTKLYNSAGFGLRYTTPIGPIALDFGVDIANPKEQYAINFHIGELF